MKGLHQVATRNSAREICLRMSVFEDTFEVVEVDPDGKKFERGVCLLRCLFSTLCSRRSCFLVQPDLATNTTQLTCRPRNYNSYSFPSVSRIVCRSENYGMDLICDINFELFRVDVGDRISFMLAKTLNPDGSPMDDQVCFYLLPLQLLLQFERAVFADVCLLHFTFSLFPCRRVCAWSTMVMALCNCVTHLEHVTSSALCLLFVVFECSAVRTHSTSFVPVVLFAPHVVSLTPFSFVCFSTHPMTSPV